MLTRVCVFCGSSNGGGSFYRDVAGRLGRVLARRRLGIVYGGGNVGLMGALADAALGAGGEVIGVIPEHLVAKELAHGSVDLRIVHSMHERKALMGDLADAFVALPGGFGTLEEFLEVLTWSQLGLHAKPCALLNAQNYFDSLLSFFEHTVREGFVRHESRSLVLVDDDPERLIDRLAAWQPPALRQWIDRDER